MERWPSDPGVTRFWYTVTFLAGLYWSISLLIGTFGELFIFWAPSLVCLGAAFRLVGRFQAQLIAEALNLLAMFGVGAEIGGVLELIGVIEFLGDRFQFFRALAPSVKRKRDQSSILCLVSHF